MAERRVYMIGAVSPNFLARSCRCSSIYFVWPKIRVMMRKNGFLIAATSVGTTLEPPSAGDCFRVIERAIIVLAGKV